MQKKIVFNYKKIILHFLFWGLTWFFFYTFFSVGSSNKEFLFWFSTLLSAISVITSYFFVYDLIPKYLIVKKYHQFALYSFYTAVFVTAAVLMTMAFGFVFFFNLEFQKMPTLTKSSSVILVCVLLIVALASALKILKHSYKSLEEKKTIENKFLQKKLELKEQELRFLKMQIHPHFLFNSLNTIYGFAIAKADEAPEMILKLSNLLDYILYQVEKPKVLLTEEVNHLEDYISLEKMRFHDSLKVSFKKENLNDSLQIPPMLLIPFIENSFKHGNLKNGVLNINIDLACTEKSIHFRIENSNMKPESINHGIGLDNIKKRLDLSYENNYDLNIKNSDSLFIVDLKLNFN